jgi:hypothetical protein
MASFTYLDEEKPDAGFTYIDDALPKPKQNTGIAGDIGTAIKRGVLQIPGMATGLADIAAAPVSIATGINRPVSRAADWIGEQTGFRPGKWAEDANAEYSPAMQQAQQNVEQAKGFFPTLGAVAQNPRVAAQVVAESLPATIAGGLVARGAMGAVAGAEKLAALRAAAGSADAAVANAARRELLKSGAIAAGVGEGAVSAGLQMAQTGYDVDPALAAGAALGAGVGTGIIGGLSGRVAGSALGRKLGLSDIETSMAAGTFGENAGKAGAAGYARRIGAGAIQEGLVEEAPQSYQEQVWQNRAAGKPLTEGAAEAAALGAVAGGVMGGGVNAISGPLTKAVAAAPVTTVPSTVPVPDAGIQPQDTLNAERISPEQGAAQTPAGIASAAQFPQFTAPPQPVTGGAPLEQAPTAMPVPQATQNAPAAPGSPSPVSAADTTLPAKQAEAAGVPTTGPTADASDQAQIAVPSAQGPEAQPAAGAVAGEVRQGIASAATSNPVVSQVAKKAPTRKPKQSVAPRVVQGEVGMKIAPGEVATTLSGRQTTPFPKFNTERGDLSVQRLKDVDKWLLSNAADEAASRGDGFNERIFRQDLAGKTIPSASKDAAEEYLFGYQPDVQKPVTRQLVQATKAATEPKLVTKDTTSVNQGIAAAALPPLQYPKQTASIAGPLPQTATAMPVGRFGAPAQQPKKPAQQFVQPPLTTRAQPSETSVLPQTAAQMPVGKFGERANGVEAPKPQDQTITNFIASRTPAQLAYIAANGKPGYREAAKARMASDGAKAVDAKAPTKPVDEIAKTIHSSIADEVIKRAKKHSTPDRAAELESFWRNEKPSGHATEMAQAIADKNPIPLLRVLVGAYSMNQGTARAFERLTGYSLRGNSESRTKAIFDWAGWSEQQVADHVAEKRKAMESSANKRAEARDRANADDMKSRKYRTPDGGEISAADIIDDRIRQGFTEIREGKQGAAKTWTQANPETRSGYRLRDKREADYLAYRISQMKLAGPEVPPNVSADISPDISPDEDLKAARRAKVEALRQRYMAAKPDTAGQAARVATAGGKLAETAKAAVDGGRARLSDLRSRMVASMEVRRIEADAQHIDGKEVEKATPAVIKEAVSEGAQKAGLDLRQAHAILLQQIDTAIASAPSEKDSGGNAYVAFKIRKDTTDSIPNTKAHLVEYRAKRANSGANAPFLKKIDEAIAAAPQVSDAFVVFDVPGDGKFKITNTKERLDLFRKKIASNAAGFRPLPKRQPYKSPLQKKPQAGTASDETIRDMLQSGELTAALELSKVVGRPLVFGFNTNPGEAPLVYSHMEPVSFKGFEGFKFSAGRSVPPIKGASGQWAVINMESGVEVGSVGATREKAIEDAKKSLGRINPEQLQKAIEDRIKTGAGSSQAELESRWLKWAEEEEYRIDNAEAIQQKADKERADKAKSAVEKWKDLTGINAAGDPLNPPSMDGVLAGYVAADKLGNGDKFLDYVESALANSDGWQQKMILSRLNLIRTFRGDGWSYDMAGSDAGRQRVEFEATSDDGRKISAGINVEKDLASGFVREDGIIKAKVGIDDSLTVVEARKQADKAIAALMKPAKKDPALTKDIPETVKDMVSWNVAKLRDIEKSLEGVERARGKGHILALELRDRQQEISKAQEKLATFRQMAKDKGVDADGIIADLGGEPDFERFGKPAPADEPQSRIVTPDSLNLLRNPVGNGDTVRFADGSEWVAKTGWTGGPGAWTLLQGRKEHPTIKGIDGQSEFIRAIAEEEDRLRKPAPAAEPAAQYRYALVNRPASMGAVPKVQFTVEPRPPAGSPHHDLARHGIMVTDRKLTDQEVASFELAVIADEETESRLADDVAEQFGEYAAQWIEDQKDDPRGFVAAVGQSVGRATGKVRHSIGDMEKFANAVLRRLKEAQKPAEAPKAEAVPEEKPVRQRAQKKTVIPLATASQIIGRVWQNAAYNKSKWPRIKASLVAQMQEAGLPKWAVESALESAMTTFSRTADGRIGYPNTATVLREMINRGFVEAEPEQKPAEPAEKPPAFNTEDAGSELTYNRRNRLTRGLKWEDIADKDEALRVKEVTKAKVYPKPDYQALIDGGMTPTDAYMVKLVYDSIAIKPNTRRRRQTLTCGGTSTALAASCLMPSNGRTTILCPGPHC